MLSNQEIREIDQELATIFDKQKTSRVTSIFEAIDARVIQLGSLTLTVCTYIRNLFVRKNTALDRRLNEVKALRERINLK